MRKYFLLLSTLLTSFFPLYAQKHFKKFDAVSDKAIHKIRAYKDGVFLATEEGLIRISGSSFSKLKVEHSLEDTPLSALMVRPDGSKIVGSYNSMLLREKSDAYEAEDFSFLGLHIVTDIEEDNEQRLWISTHGRGIWHISERQTKSFYDKSVSDKICNDAYEIEIDKKNRKWIAASTGLYRMDSNKRWKLYDAPARVSAIELHDDNLWVAGISEDGQSTLLCYEKLRRWKVIDLPSKMTYSRITDINFDSDRQMWLTAGVVAMRAPSGMWTLYDAQKGFESSSALCVETDQYNNVWVGTEGKGLFVIFDDRFEQELEQEKPEILFGAAPETVIGNKPLESLSDILDAEDLNTEQLNKDFVLNINFEQSKAVLLEEHSEELGRLLKVLKRFPELKLQLSGHTDNIGDPGLNLKLSQARADAVKQYLIAEGITTLRVRSVGYGGKFPLVRNSGHSSIGKNRRVEARFVRKL